MNPSETSQGTNICASCGHSEGAHLFNAATEYPSEGWVTCPEPDCDCYSTWSLDDVSKPQMEKIRDEYYKGLEAKDALKRNS
jgi:hypothetical protein